MTIPQPVRALANPIRVLHLTLKKKWFQQIASGQKTIEYREMKAYWFKRFYEKDGKVKTFDEVHFRNGYSRFAPFMRVEWKGLSISKESPLGPHLAYAIQLGAVLYCGQAVIGPKEWD